MSPPLPAAFSGLDRVLAQDPGRRGIAGLFEPGALEAAARSLHRARRCAIVTGWPVPPAAAAETDGPPGAVSLGEALARLGVEVTYAADPRVVPCLEALGAAPLDPVTIRAGAPPEERRTAAASYLEQVRPSHLVAVELPGRAADGTYRSMRGEEITAATSALDELFLSAPAAGVTTVAVGDGGNEVGMGRVRERVTVSVPQGERIGSVVPADHLVVAGVSTWGAWGLVAGLGLLSQEDLLPAPETVREQLEQLVAAGALDGVSRRPEATLDGLPLRRSLQVLAALRAACGWSG